MWKGLFGCWPCPARGQTRIADLIWDQQRQETMPDVPTQPVWVIALPEKTYIAASAQDRHDHQPGLGGTARLRGGGEGKTEKVAQSSSGVLCASSRRDGPTAAIVNKEAARSPTG